MIVAIKSPPPIFHLRNKAAHHSMTRLCACLLTTNKLTQLWPIAISPVITLVLLKFDCQTYFNYCYMYLTYLESITSS